MKENSQWSYRLLLTDLNLTPNAIAFCATALRVRRSFFATCGPESFAFARALKAFTSSFDHGRTTRFFFAITALPYIERRALYRVDCPIDLPIGKRDTMTSTLQYTHG